MTTRLLSLLMLVLAGLVALAVFWQPTMPIEPEVPPGPSGGDFTLHSAEGPVDTATLRGKLVLVYFGYTYCPDICPTALASVAQALNSLTADEQARVRMVFVSVDPRRDTPARLKDYVAFFHPAIVGVTGSDAEIEAAAAKYGAFFTRHDTEDKTTYMVDHSAWIYIVAPDGRLVGRLEHGTSPDQTLADIRAWLPASPPPKGNP